MRVQFARPSGEGPVRMNRAPDVPYLMARQFMAARYGGMLARVPVDFGLSCPHREGPHGGCTFCSSNGSRAGYAPAKYSSGSVPVGKQARAGVEFARRRYGAQRFIAYVQAFTGTFATVDVQRRLYDELLTAHSFEVLAVGTRPDCLPDPTLALLCELQQRLEVWVELGVQTVHDRTLERIRRGHTWACSRAAIERLHACGIGIVAHVILGLPGETETDVRKTAETLAGLPLLGVKIHNLHVLRGTRLAEEYAQAPFCIFDEREYGEILIDFLRRIPPQVAVLRTLTDTPDDERIVPRWQMKKGQFQEYLVREMLRIGARQGDWVP